MKVNGKIALAAAGIALVAGGGGAYAATRDTSPTPQQEQQAFLDDFAKHLGVSSSSVVSAFKAALADRIDTAVAAGRLTKAQGDALKARIQSAQVPFGLGPLGFGFGFKFGLGPGVEFGRHGDVLSAAATYLGVTETALATELKSGKSLAQVAQEKGKDVNGLVTALVKAEKADLDQVVKNGMLTQAQEDGIVSALQAKLTALVNNTFPGRLAFGFRAGPLLMPLLPHRRS